MPTSAPPPDRDDLADMLLRMASQESGTTAQRMLRCAAAVRRAESTTLTPVVTRREVYAERKRAAEIGLSLPMPRQRTKRLQVQGPPKPTLDELLTMAKAI